MSYKQIALQVIFCREEEELGTTRESILEMASAAYAIGGETQGESKSLCTLSGMGRVDSTCSIASIDKLVEGKINDPLYKAFTKLEVLAKYGS